MSVPMSHLIVALPSIINVDRTLRTTGVHMVKRARDATIYFDRDVQCHVDTEVGANPCLFSWRVRASEMHNVCQVSRSPSQAKTAIWSEKTLATHARLRYSNQQWGGPRQPPTWRICRRLRPAL